MTRSGFTDPAVQLARITGGRVTRVLTPELARELYDAWERRTKGQVHRDLLALARRFPGCYRNSTWQRP